MGIEEKKKKRIHFILSSRLPVVLRIPALLDCLENHSSPADKAFLG